MITAPQPLTSDLRPLTSGSLLALMASFSLFAQEEPKFADPFLLTNNPGLFSVEPRLAEPPPPSPGATNPLLPDPTTASEAETNLPTAVSTISMDALDDKYRLAISDRLSFRIQEDEEDPKPLFVTDSGDLELPYLGRYPAVGKTCKELARALKAELEKEYYYQATVIIAVDVMTKNRGKVYLVGPVRAPGPQEIPSDEVLTLSKAILRAGGFNDYADRHNVKVTRKGTGPAGENQTFIVNVTEILEKGRTETDLPLEPGDLIYIPERLIRF